MDSTIRKNVTAYVSDNGDGFSDPKLIQNRYFVLGKLLRCVIFHRLSLSEIKMSYYVPSLIAFETSLWYSFQRQWHFWECIVRRVKFRQLIWICFNFELTPFSQQTINAWKDKKIKYRYKSHKTRVQYHNNVAAEIDFSFAYNLVRFFVPIVLLVSVMHCKI